MSYYCYILRSVNPLYPNNTYVGMTVNPTRRLRQHNGELVGGAKATKTRQPYEMYCIISGFPTLHDALSYEWHIKHPSGKKKVPGNFTGINGRIKGLKHVMETRTPPFDIIINIKEDCINLLDGLTHEGMENIKVVIIP
ncbi:MAG: GIY-YIG nuclease [Terrestrivirus sp.]|uniref:GIY-YIG nuclease n=1 Tax=Terrestrivirus sp. TaxID=2487775 RepID=A0A3G4ZPN0_9VIRU|nr:MAG: GIY-YIG nuclease [Terrestrivirus sp.]